MSQSSDTLWRYLLERGLWSLLAISLVGTAQTSAQDQGELAAPTGLEAPDADVEPDRFREGAALVDRTGYFTVSGDRAMFETSDGKHRFIGLENLNLERIVRMINENPERVEWSVTGTVTEYRGANYLLIRRAFRKLASSAPRTSRPLTSEPANTPTVSP
ncbi:MAG: hypothetical protein WDZ59_17610 [Pirellulales bacterium]